MGQSVNVLVTVHGIRDTGLWQDRLSEIYMAGDPSNRRAERYHFGFFDILRFLFPPTRAYQVRVFRERLQSLLARLRNDGLHPTLHFAAHSFGTHVVFNALRTLPSDDRGWVGNVVFMSSVLPSFSDVDPLLSMSTGAMHNFCSVNDAVLVVNAMLPLGSGLAGRVGFAGVFEGDRFQQRYFRHGHGGYFQSIDSPSNWLSRYAMPALLDQAVPPGTHQRPKYGDFFSSFLTATKALTSVVAVGALVLAVTLLTSNGVLLSLREQATKVQGQKKLTLLDLPQVAALKPKWPHSWLPEFETFRKDVVQPLFDRITFENDIAHIFEGVPSGVDLAIRRSDSAILHQTSSGLELDLPDSASATLRFRLGSSVLSAARDSGFTDADKPYYVADQTLHIAGSVNELVDWKTYGMPDLDVDITNVSELGEGRLIVQSFPLFFVAGEGEPLKRVDTQDQWDRPNVEDAFSGGMAAMSLSNQFDAYVFIGDQNSVLFINIQTQENLLVSQDVHDVGGHEHSIDSNVASEMRNEQVRTGKGETGVTGPLESGQYCAHGTCEQWRIAFGPEVSGFWPYTIGDGLFLVVTDGKTAPYCLRIATVGGNGAGAKLSSVDPASQQSACPEPIEEVDGFDAVPANSSELARADFPGQGGMWGRDGSRLWLRENSLAMEAFERSGTERIASVPLSQCVEHFDGSTLIELGVSYAFGSLYIQCGGQLARYGRWGLLESRAIPDWPHSANPRGVAFPIIVNGDWWGTVAQTLKGLAWYDPDGVEHVLPSPADYSGDNLTAWISGDTTFLAWIDGYTSLHWMPAHYQDGTLIFGNAVKSDLSVFSDTVITGFCENNILRMDLNRGSADATTAFVSSEDGAILEGSPSCTTPGESLDLQFLDFDEFGASRKDAMQYHGRDLRWADGVPSALQIRRTVPNEDPEDRAKALLAAITNQFP